MTRLAAGMLGFALTLALSAPQVCSAADAQGNQGNAPGTAAEQSPPASPVSGAEVPQLPPLPPPLPPADQTQQLELPTPAAQYYVEQNGAPVGPFSLEQVTQLVAGGTVQRSTRVWKTGTPEWVTADTITEINAVLQQAAPPELPATARFEAYILGTWEAVREDDFGTIHRINVRYERDGSFSGIIESWVPDVPNPAYQAIEGTWSIKALGQDRFTLTTTTKNGGPSTGALRIIGEDIVENDLGQRSTRISR